ncbi:hypothetical protein Tco_1512235, partial [Tanacetum coccineum]
MASSSSSSSYLIRFHRGGVFVSDPFSYDYEILSEIPNVEMDAMNFVSFVKFLVSECSSDIKQIFFIKYICVSLSSLSLSYSYILPRDEFVEKDVSADKDVTDKDNI